MAPRSALASACVAWLLLAAAVCAPGAAARNSAGPGLGRRLHRALRADVVAAPAAGVADRPASAGAAAVAAELSTGVTILAEGSAAGDVKGEPAPAYTYLGCYVDGINNFRGQRRMRRRLAIVDKNTLTVTECARRAAMFGYTLFGVTAYEDRPEEGAYTCWGSGEFGKEAADLRWAQGQDPEQPWGYGPSTDCTQTCVTAPDSTATACGGWFALSLYQINNAVAPALLGGAWQVLGTVPVATGHIIQVTGREDYLLVDFYNNAPAHPAYDYTYAAMVYHRDNKTWDKMPFYNNELKSVACGAFGRLSDGEIAGFSGHVALTAPNGVTFEENFKGVHMLWKHQMLLEHLEPLTWGRWYPSVVNGPDGRMVVTAGGDNRGRGEGSEVFDVSQMWLVGRKPNVETAYGPMPLNPALMQGVGGVASYYPVVQYLPDGAMLYIQNILVQSLNPVTGAGIAQTEPTPYLVAPQFPYSVPTLVTQHLQWWPGYDWMVYVILFGGKWYENPTDYRPCKDTSLRTLFVINAKGQHWFSPWTVETMPGPRCYSAGVPLPNNKIVIVAGNEMPYPGISPYVSQNDYSDNEAWIYNYAAPYGRRFQRTGAYTRQHRSYHSVALLTGRGDVLVAGSSVSNDFRWYVRGGMEWTRQGQGTGNYALETFTPHYISGALGPRPLLASAPIAFAYGSIIDVTVYAYGLTINKVILAENGCNTHSANLGYRHVQLTNWVKGTTGAGNDMVTTISVMAPANTFVASPGFYQLYLVATNDVYSGAKWIQLRGAWDSVPVTLRTSASKVVDAATSNFDNGNSPFTCLDVACLANVDPAAAGTTGSGLRVRAQGPNDGAAKTVSLLSDPFAMAAGDRVHTHLWARMTEGGPVFATLTVALVDVTGAAVSVTLGPNRSPQLSAVLTGTFEYIPLGGIINTDAGQRRLKLTFAGCQSNTGIDLDDVVTTVIAAGAKPMPVRAAGAGDVAGSDGQAAAATSAEEENITTARRDSNPPYFGDWSAVPQGSLQPRSDLPDMSSVPHFDPHMHAHDS